MASNGIFKLSLIAFCLSLATMPAHAQTLELMQQDRQAEEEDTRRFFEQAHGALDKALEAFDEKHLLPGEEDLAFYNFLATTQEDQQEKIQSYLDVAAEALGVSDITDRREKIADLKKQIEANQSNITVYKRKRISAPESSYNPLVTTRSGYDKKIEKARQDIQVANEEIQAEKDALLAQLNKIGMELDPETIDMLLESVTGDEFVKISVIFDNAKRFALKLENLTEQSGEDPEAAKKYYGVYLMLLKTVDRLQNKFVDNVDKVYYPQLEQFAEQAQKNIADAERAIKLGGNAQVLRNNIASNEETYDVAGFYKESLSHQKHQMMMANLECKKNILTAANTYKTAALSKDMAELMAVSRRAFDAITSLAVPDLRPFENKKMKQAFSEMTRQLRK